MGQVSCWLGKACSSLWRAGRAFRLGRNLEGALAFAYKGVTLGAQGVWFGDTLALNEVCFSRIGCLVVFSLQRAAIQGAAGGVDESNAASLH